MDSPASKPSCADAQICPALSLTDFFGGSSRPHRLDSGQPATRAPGDVHARVQALPYFITQIVISLARVNPTPGDPIGDTADVSFGIRVQPLSDQQSLIDDIRAPDQPAGSPRPGGRRASRSRAFRFSRPTRTRSSPRAASG